MYSSFIYDHQKLEATKTSFDKKISKQTVVYPFNGIVFGNFLKKSYQSTKRDRRDSIHISKHKSQTGKATYCVIPKMGHFAKGKL